MKYWILDKSKTTQFYICLGIYVMGFHALLYMLRVTLFNCILLPILDFRVCTLGGSGGTSHFPAQNEKCNYLPHRCEQFQCSL